MCRAALISLLVHILMMESISGLCDHCYDSAFFCESPLVVPDSPWPTVMPEWRWCGVAIQNPMYRFARISTTAHKNICDDLKDLVGVELAGTSCGRRTVTAGDLQVRCKDFLL